VKDYDRYFCFRDQEYAAEEIGREPVPADDAEPVSSPDVLSIDEMLGAEVAPPSTATSESERASSAAVAQEPAPETALPQSSTPAESPMLAPIPEASEPRPQTEMPQETIPRAPSESPKETPKSPPRLVLARPPLVKEEIMKAKKAALMELAAASGLDTMGTKEELRVRLLAEYNRLRREELRKIAGPAQAAAPQDPIVQEPAQPGVALESPPATPSRAPEAVTMTAPIAPQTHREAPSAPTPVLRHDAQQFAPTSTAPLVIPSPMAPPDSTSDDSPQPSQTQLLPGPPKLMNPCPTCGRELAYIERYDRYYCDRCKAYAPPPVKVVTVPPPPRVGRPCATCGRELTYVEQYDRHYCYYCKAYAPLEMARPAVGPSAHVLEPRLETVHVGTRNACSTCGRELSYVARYARYYCYDCGKYAPPRPKHPCPNCGKSLTYVSQYRRHYCYGCSQYAPVELTVNILAERAVVVPGSSAAARIAPTTRSNVAPRHGSLIVPATISAIGLLLATAFHLLVALPLSAGEQPLINIDGRTAWLIEFLGLLLLGTGVVMALVRLRARM